MSFNIENHQDKLLFIPLGGTNEIGMNVSLYHIDGKFIMIDCGSGFADDYLPGVDILVADLTFVEKNKKDLLGVILTHAHEDHVGGIQYLWENLECPIYTTKFTKNFLKNKLSEYSFSQKVKINEVTPGEVFTLGSFKIETMPLTHSAPEMQALMIRTKAGNIFHTGDWKFDPNPLVGKAVDETLLAKYGKEGVLALVCDSTNVFNAGTSGSEGDVRDNLVKLVSECPALVVVTTFASNIARIGTIIHAAEKAGRKVVLTGRSLHRIIEAAQSSGYLNDIRPFVDERSICRHKKKDLLVIATGCQGEPLAATSKMAHGSHHSIYLNSKDTVIFSSKIIPGNDKKIFRLFNSFVRKGIEVITERDHMVHVSGHPAIDELKKMYELIKPKICIPVHGEPVHIHEQSKLAKSEGIKLTIEVANGSVAHISESNPKVIGTVKSGYFAVDGNFLLPEDSSIFRMRRRMRDAGIVIATIVVDKEYNLVVPPVLSMPGLLDHKNDLPFITDIKDDIIKSLTKQKKQTDLRDMSKSKIESCVRSALRRTLRHEINKSAHIIVNVEEKK